MKFAQIFAGIAIVLMVSSTAFAAKGGNPSHTGLSGKDFGQATSGLAQSEPGGANWRTGAGSRAGGNPAAHGLSGKDFGQATSGLAQSSPGAVKDHKDEQTGD